MSICQDLMVSDIISLTNMPLIPYITTCSSIVCVTKSIFVLGIIITADICTDMQTFVQDLQRAAMCHVSLCHAWAVSHACIA